MATRIIDLEDLPTNASSCLAMARIIPLTARMIGSHCDLVVEMVGQL